MRPFDLDPDAADRLLAGHGAAPAGFEAVAAALAAARQAATATAAPAQTPPTVAAMVDVVRTSLADPAGADLVRHGTPARRLAGRVLRPRVAVAGVVGALSLSGVAAAATGSLPG